VPQAQRGEQPAAGAADNVLELGRTGQRGAGDVYRSSEGGRRGCPLRALHEERRTARAIEVKHGEREAGLQEVCGHRGAHVAESDEADVKTRSREVIGRHEGII
jgi:hypothetical protein